MTHIDTSHRWRHEASSDSPAGPLFAGGQYVEAEIVSEASEATLHCSGQCGTACSGSGMYNCC